MEQIKPVLAHLVAHRFWYTLGLSALFAALITGGSSALAGKTKLREGLLDTSLKNVEAYKSGERPNGKWLEQASQKQAGVQGMTSSALADRYRAQEALMTWPKVVAADVKGAGAPFGADLGGREGQHLRRYLDDLEDTEGEGLQAYYELRALGLSPGGKPYGVVEAPPFRALFQLPRLDPRKTAALEAWQYQEQVWLLRALARAVVRCNQPAAERYPTDAAKAWLAARVKRIDRFDLGDDARDPRALGAKAALVPYAAPPADAATAGGPVSQLPNAARYLEKVPEYRTVPVAARLVVDQREITAVLREFANVEFSYVTLNAKLSPLTGGKLEKPLALANEEILIGGRRVENPLYNCMQLEVYGVCRLFEMPEKLKQEREAAATKAGAPAAPAAEAKK